MVERNNKYKYKIHSRKDYIIPSKFNIYLNQT